MKKLYEDLKKSFESKSVMGILYGVGIAILAMLIFSAGIAVGFHKASFSRSWGEHYSDNFFNMPVRRNLGIGGDHFPNAHGAIGKIINIELPNIIVEDRDTLEKVILLHEDAKIQKERENILSADLKLDDFIVVIGAPNDQGMIDAKFIRVIPSPEFFNK